MEDFLEELTELSLKHNIVVLAIGYKTEGHSNGGYKYYIEDGQAKIEWINPSEESIN